jgi:hypothetical protein
MLWEKQGSGLEKAIEVDGNRSERSSTNVGQSYDDDFSPYAITDGTEQFQRVLYRYLKDACR